jgi:hypothetical protein
VHQVVAVLVGHILVALFVAIILGVPTPESNLGKRCLIDIAAAIMTYYLVFKVWYLGVESMKMQKHIQAAILDDSKLIPGSWQAVLASLDVAAARPVLPQGDLSQPQTV